MSFIGTLALAMGSAWVSGINLYAAVATLGLLSRFSDLKLPGDLQVLNNWWVIGIAAGLYAIEFFADKIPFLDSAWDVIHTFIRIPAGAVLAAGAFGDFNPAVQVVALLLGGGLALSSHGAKAATRAAINTSPEPASNIAASLLEDLVAFSSMLAAYFVPVLLIALITVFTIASLIILPHLLRFAGRFFRKSHPQTEPK